MKILLILLFLLISTSSFCQLDSISRSKEIYLISFKNFDSDIVEVKDVKVVSNDSDYITYEDAVYNNIKNTWSPRINSLKYDQINSFGYKVGTNFGQRVGIGALAGFGVGFVLGFLAGDFNPVGDSHNNGIGRLGTGSLFGIAAAIPCALIAALTGIGSKEYEVVDVSKYDQERKYAVLKSLIQKGIKKNK